MDARGPGHFSMIRAFRLADLFTLLNGFLGAGAVLSFMEFCVHRDATYFWVGTSLLPLAFVMDALDGRIARLRGVASPMGQELDSLADIVSFGVAPAAMAFAAGLRGGWDALFLIYFVGCGISRLARYNVTASAAAAAATKVKYFEGFPIPTSLLLVGAARGARRPGPLAGTAAPRRLLAGRADAAPAQHRVRPPRQRDDQQDAAHPEAVNRKSALRKA